MATTLSDRALFVTNEYRYAEVPDAAAQAAIRLEQPSSTSEEYVTNLSLEGATQLASELAGDLGRYTQAYSYTVEGVDHVNADSFDGSPPMFDCKLFGFPHRVQRATTVTVDYSSFTTTIQSRG